MDLCFDYDEHVDAFLACAKHFQLVVTLQKPGNIEVVDPILTQTFLSAAKIGSFVYRRHIADTLLMCVEALYNVKFEDFFAGKYAPDSVLYARERFADYFLEGSTSVVSASIPNYASDSVATVTLAGFLVHLRGFISVLIAQ